MDPSILRGLNDKIYDRRKAAALELEKLVLSSDVPRISSIIDQLCGMFSSSNSALHTRNGGLIGLAATAIALGQDVAPFLGVIIPPVLACFQDPESRVRYHACEMSKGEILVHFNEIFDALSKLSSDSEMSVKNGAELLDRLMKDIVAEAAPTYVSIYPGNINPNLPRYHEASSIHSKLGALGIDDQQHTTDTEPKEDKRAFSLARFIPLLSERVYVISPYTRMHLVSWLMVLDSVPDLELVAWLPDFLDGLLKYLADGNVDVRLATENVLAEFLREIKYIATVQEKQAADRARRESRSLRTIGSKQTLEDDNEAVIEEEDEEEDGEEEPWEGEGSGAWVPGQGVYVDHAAIMDIIIQHLSYPDELVQSTAMEWVLTFLEFAQNTVVAFTPRIVPAILPNLASSNRHIKLAAHETNGNLYRVIQSLPLQVQPSQQASSPPPSNAIMGTSPAKDDPLEAKTITPSLSTASVPTLNKIKPTPPASEPVTPATAEFPAGSTTKPKSRPASPSAGPMSPVPETLGDDDPFDVRETVNVLTLQFLSDHAETRIAALEWLLMLHLKAPTKILSRESGTFPALLKTLSDPSEDVVKHDLQLLAQISASSEESYFTSFMVNVLELFSTDRRLLETRGSLIIRQLCLHLNAERIFRTIADILEKDDDLEFASMMVVKLNMILITSPELADFRRRLKNLESKDGQMLFSSLYRSWCHNAVAVFALCLLAQAYEHASNLLQIFAELELTVSLLVQIDKLVMLLESPVFTSLRLQLLEPDKYPYLPKCLYGLLMILPQSSAFVSLRARLSVVHSSGYVPTPSKTAPSAFPAAPRSKLGTEIKWQELLSHFRSVQMRHEKARRQLHAEHTSSSSIHYSSPSQTYISAPNTSATQVSGPSKSATIKKKSVSSTGGRPSGGPGMSALNPKRGGSVASASSAALSIGGAVASMNANAGVGGRPMSPPQGRRKMLGGIRKGG
ncbi:hypothetical protein EHS25_010232 [Saitozyma podzolica]|uniref:Vacuolar protein 14 C-terminal Fig4-binding domain-containing protein n=1 Tax=Saitozyma podzolica TaxID=1890683 RepID=A0A427YIZ3_9TREE|nr:hypothetical protein EHS25_010232 [Saitozyma podzolica]